MAQDTFEELINFTLLGKYNEQLNTQIEKKIGEIKTGDKLTLQNLAEATAGMAKTYELKQGDVSVGKIDIPKDKFVSSVKLEKDPSEQEPGQYIVIGFSNEADDKVYLNVDDLFNVVYTAKADADKIQLAISGTGEISAAVVAGSIAEEDLSAAVTAKIAKIATLEGTVGALGARVDTLEAKEIPTITLATEEQIDGLFT